MVGYFQTNSRLRGFFVQEGETDFDGSNLTSEGIFVYDDTKRIIFDIYNIAFLFYPDSISRFANSISFIIELNLQVFQALVCV